MKNRNYVSTILMVLACGVFITSCEDVIDEGQILDSQYQRADEIAQREADAEAALSAENAAALAAAQLLDYTLTLHSDNVPAEGVAVNLTNNAGTTVSVTTDADGNAIFTGLAMGGHTVSISSSDFLDASYNVDFGTPIAGINYEIIDGKVYPLGTNAESSKVELYSLSGMQAATLTGNVEIETDLTNNDPEVPQDITIRANLDGLNPTNSHSFIDEYNQNSSSIYVSGSFTFTEGDIGVATVDNTTGEYTMQVPATDDGTDIELLFPLVEANQTLGWAYEDGEYVGAQIGPQAALFGPDIDATNTPSIDGVVAEFPAPANPGRGFTLGNFQALPQEFPIGVIDDFPVETDFSALFEFRGNPGSDDFQLSPIITVNDPEVESEQAPKIEPIMTWFVESLDIDSWDGMTWAANDQILFFLMATYEDNSTENLGAIAAIDLDGNGDPVNGIDTQNVDFEAPNQSIKSVVNFSIDPVSVFNNPVGDATFSNIVRSGSIDYFLVDQPGDGYTSIPNITIGDEGNPTTPATLEITEMAFTHSFDLDNTEVTQAYVALPGIMFEYEDAPGDTDTLLDVSVGVLDENGFIEMEEKLELFAVPIPLQTALRVSGNALVFDNDAFFGTTDIEKGLFLAPSFSTPRAIIVEPTHEQTTADVDVNSDGEITGLSNITVGTGYTSEYTAQLTSQSGTGGIIDLVGFDTNERTGEVTWSGNAIATDGGSGYVSSMNIAEESFTPSATSQVIKIRNGETKIVNVNYGTGKPVADIQDPQF